MAAGLTSGSIAAVVTSPLELIKTRLQATALGAGAQQAPSSALSVVRSVVAADGVAGLWRGAVPGVIRAALLTASQVATYDQVKHGVIARTGWGDHAGTHLAASMISGLVVTTATNPADCVKTVMFTSGGGAGGLAACTARIWRQQGAAGFMRGWSANYARLGPQTVVTFLMAEQLRSLAGLRRF